MADKIKTVQIRATRAERKAWAAAAEAAGLTLSEWIRRACLEDIKPQSN
jgi:uncharacterized protein (DUF1778 family)